MKAKLFNFTTYVLLGMSILSATIITYPELFKWIPEQFNGVTALITAGATGLLGSGGIAVQSYLLRARNEADTQFFTLADAYKKLEGKYDVVSGRVDTLDNTIKALNKDIRRLIELQEADLKAKKSDVLIDQKTKEMLEGVLDEE